MKIKPLGETGLLVSELGFGAFAIGGNATGNSYGPTDDLTSLAAVRAAVDLGYTFFDTANVYGNGHSEELLGQALAEAGCKNTVVIASKVGGRFSAHDGDNTYAPACITEALEASLRRLGRDYLDLYQLHNPPQSVVEQGDVFDVLERLRAAGKIRSYGVSIHTPADGWACLREGHAQTLQLAYNLLSLMQPEESLEQPGISLAQAALRFVLDEPAISTTIVGIKTPAQALANLQATLLPSFSELEQASL